jgi:L,D-transpeptidase ErfK/SrfK
MSVGPGPENPLGTHALYLGWPQYLMHGTNKPYGIGRRVSSGCMRMYPEDIVKLFPQVPVGTPVTVVDQPVKVGWINDSLFVEVSPSQEQAARIEEDADVIPKYHLSLEDVKRINDKAGVHKDKINWGIIRAAVKQRSGVPVEVMNIHGNAIIGAIADSDLSVPNSNKSRQENIYSVDPVQHYQ